MSQELAAIGRSGLGLELRLPLPLTPTAALALTLSLTMGSLHRSAEREQAAAHRLESKQQELKIPEPEP
jgi:hypothetical protein